MMNLTSPSQVKAWCIENGFHPNKVLGQNFLIDRNALVAIVDAGLEGIEKVPGESLNILEIGPGLGVLTEELLKRGGFVTAIEKDPVLAARLSAEAKTRSTTEAWWKNLTVIEGDALPILSSPPSENFFAGFDCMVSNLPYQAGTRILLELTERRTIPAMTVLVQTEVAERLAAGPGTKTRGLAGVLAQLDYDVEIVRKVGANCFWPRPEIGSSVVRLRRHHRCEALTAEERRTFKMLVKLGFEQRRKQLGSIFKGVIESTARAEELANEDWLTLVGLMLHHKGRRLL